MPRTLAEPCSTPSRDLRRLDKNSQLSQIWVACSDKAILGLCGLLVYEGESEIEPLVVDPDHRNLGIGSVLVERAISRSRELGAKFVNVRPVARNVDAIRFFHRAGFGLLGRLELSIALNSTPSTSSERTANLHGLRFDY